MAYTLDTSLFLGTQGFTFSDLRAALVDSTGTLVGTEISSGFVNIGGGWYLWHYEAYPQGFRGGVKYYSQVDPANVLIFVPINPEESEVLGVVESLSQANTVVINTGHSQNPVVATGCGPQVDHDLGIRIKTGVRKP